MHKDVHGPSASRWLNELMCDLDRWEGKLTKYYRCRGAMAPDGTKVLIAMGMLPANTSPVSSWC